MKKFRNVLGLMMTLVLAGCETIGFYQQAAMGQIELLRARTPIDRILSGGDEPEIVREKLTMVQGILDFAETRIGLEVGQRYRSYADIDRSFVVWNVFAAKPLSVVGKQWCYPIVGCAPYRGYFSQDRAERYASKLRTEGFETYVGGVPAYSTLGWFDDPVLSTFLDWPEPDLAALLLHELAHSRIWVEDDVVFNESFATAVAEIALREYFSIQNRDHDYQSWRVQRRDWEAMRARLIELKDSLSALYSDETMTDEMRTTARDEAYRLFVESYEANRSELGAGRFDRLVRENLNNAYLVSLGAYEDWVPAFLRIYREHGDWASFFDAVDELAALSQDDRNAAMESVSHK